MKKGDLYILKDREALQRALFPYFSGGQALIVSVKDGTMLIPMKGYEKIKIVEFLYDGKTYVESMNTFLENATKVGEDNESKSI